MVSGFEHPDLFSSRLVNIWYHCVWQADIPPYPLVPVPYIPDVELARGEPGCDPRERPVLPPDPGPHPANGQSATRAP